jgi:hypothetical protein
VNQSHRNTTPSFTFTNTVSGTSFEFTPERLIIAGLTGRDETARQHHIDELKALGITVPDSVPAFWEVPLSLLRASDAIQVQGAETSGEVEPVLVCTSHGWYIAVGSDHTDRHMERTDLHASKAACPKPVSRDLVPAEPLMDTWGDLRIRSWAGDTLYQDAGLDEMMMPLRAIVKAYESHLGQPAEGLVMFLGTVPTVSGELNYDTSFQGELAGNGVNLRRSYRVTPS